MCGKNKNTFYQKRKYQCNINTINATTQNDTTNNFLFILHDQKLSKPQGMQYDAIHNSFFRIIPRNTRCDSITIPLILAFQIPIFFCFGIWS